MAMDIKELIDNKTATTCAAVYETADYSKFSFIDGNRPIEEGRIKTLKKSIGEIGFRNVPIVVNSSLQIIDGQGRFSALKELGMPIRFVVDENATIRECRALNMNQKNWTTLDWMKSYAGIPAYDYILNVYYANKDLLNLTQTIILCATTRIGLCSTPGPTFQKMKEGKLTLARPKADVEYLIASIRKFAIFFKPVGGNIALFYSALMFVIKSERVDMGILYTRLEGNSNKLRKAADVRNAVEILNEVYNHHTNTKNKVFFVSDYDTYAARGELA